MDTEELALQCGDRLALLSPAGDSDQDEALLEALCAPLQPSVRIQVVDGACGWPRAEPQPGGPLEVCMTPETAMNLEAVAAGPVTVVACHFGSKAAHLSVLACSMANPWRSVALLRVRTFKDLDPRLRNKLHYVVLRRGAIDDALRAQMISWWPQSGLRARIDALRAAAGGDPTDFVVFALEDTVRPAHIVTAAAAVARAAPRSGVDGTGAAAAAAT